MLDLSIVDKSSKQKHMRGARCKSITRHQIHERCYKRITVDEVQGFIIPSTSICHNLISLHDPLKLARSRWNKTHPCLHRFHRAAKNLHAVCKEVLKMEA